MIGQDFNPNLTEHNALTKTQYAIKIPVSLAREHLRGGGDL